MPQAPSANMLIVWPTDHDDNDAWDIIMDTAVRFVIDSHNHTPGQGVKIPAAALNIDGDVSWSSGGTSHSITDIAALDFRAIASSVVTGLAGALFVSDGTGGLTANELYWRTTSGTNVKVTAGAALNVAAFTGGIGGDYSAVSALVVFDDATDSYWFQQQVGASVRQYARMRSADVDLYEFKANPAAGVPTNRVRLASPAALAASYAVTWPGAVPAATSIAQIDNAGTMTFSNVMAANRDITLSGTGAFKHGTQTLILPVTTPQAPGLATAQITLASSNLGFTVGIPLEVGRRITALRAFVIDSVTGPTKLVIKLSASLAGSALSTIATGAQSPGVGTLQTITLTGLTTVVALSNVYYATVVAATGSASCTLFGVEVDYDYP